MKMKEVIFINIQAGDKRTYKELCAYFNEEKKNGNAKTAQLKKWGRYINFYKMEHKNLYYINEIYDKPLPINTSRKGKYINELKVLIFHMLYHSSSSPLDNPLPDSDIIEVDTTLNSWVRSLYLVKEDIFKELIYQQPKLVKQGQKLHNTQNPKEYENFKTACIDLMRSSVLTALRGLKSISEINEHYVIYEQDEPRETTKEEIGLILKAEDYIATTMGYIDRTKASRAKPKEFYTKVENLLREQIPDLQTYRKQIQLITSKEVLERHISEYTSLDIHLSVAQLPEPKFKEIKNNLIGKYRNTIESKKEDWKPFIDDIFPLSIYPTP